MVVFYPTNTVTVEEQYELFDVNEIVSAVGGSMGLFLGFSCLGTYMSFAKCLLVVHIPNSFLLLLFSYIAASFSAEKRRRRKGAKKRKRPASEQLKRGTVRVWNFESRTWCVREIIV